MSSINGCQPTGKTLALSFSVVGRGGYYLLSMYKTYDKTVGANVV